MEHIELLAPARDLDCGIVAIDCGADAVYIGAERFGARSRAGNRLEDISRLIDHSHAYWAKVYVTVNTLLHDHELDQAAALIAELHQRGADGIILQDVGLLECGLPPVPLIASTQMHVDSAEKVAFLQEVGFSRVTLARELTLDEIRAIRGRSTVELECFVHGALCVCYSGQCTLSYGMGGRSGNRGECAQPCRLRYSLVDAEGRAVVRDRHLLSLKDLNLSDHIEALIDAGVRSFKIEGRLKDKAYVANVVAFYRQRLDEILGRKGWAKASSGQVNLDFVPDVSQTFHRGYSTYFLHGRQESIGSLDTPKMVGQRMGRVISCDRRSFTLDSHPLVVNGDGLCFFDVHDELQGTLVNHADGAVVTPDRMDGIQVGTVVYRNHNHAFTTAVARTKARRTIAVRLVLDETAGALRLSATDEDGNTAATEIACEKTAALNPTGQEATVARQLAKMGRTLFSCEDVRLAWRQPLFLPVATINAMRREVLDGLLKARAQNRPRQVRQITTNEAPYPESQLSYLGNVLNAKAEAFYHRHGVIQIERAAESGLDMRGRKVMTTKYCLRHQLGLCLAQGGGDSVHEPLTLVDEQGRRLRLRFDCAACRMEIYF
jgi:collagenase-like PrtC family protease